MAYNPIQSYLQEADELLADIEQCALLLGAGETEAETTIHRLFRAFHTLKGSGAMCGFERVAAFTHHAETMLDKVREGVLPISPALIELVLRAKDHIQVLLLAEQGARSVPEDEGERLIAAFTGFCNGREAAGGAAGKENAAGAGNASPAGPEKLWTIRFRPDANLLARGASPLLLLRDLRKLGHCDIRAHVEDIPPLDSIQPVLCYLWWTVSLRSSCAREAIQDVFIFVEDGSDIEIEETDAAVVIPAAAAPVSESTPETAAPQPAPAESPRKAVSKESTVRVPAARLDSLVNLVGELVMNQSRIARAASQAGVSELANPVQELERLIAELRDDVLGIRMLPIGTIFGRFRRLVHDLSAELHKEVDLITEGAETELDKSILDQLGEPLVHLLRNCIDHGMETAEERVANGKPRRGAIRLSAEHTGADVVLRIHDDGRGINRAAVRAKAVEKGLIAPDASLTDKEVLNLILLPGFSTAAAVTSVSGRGVGMDAVKRQIDILRGSLSIQSTEGQGATISLTLPLTLAIIDGLLVQLGRDQFIIPMAAVAENVELPRRQRQRANGRNVIPVRGELVPYVDLRATFALEGEAPPIEKIVLVRYEDQRVGLVVDRVLGTHQTVIQALGRFFRNIDVVSGATIMGDGAVALILDIASVVRLADTRARLAA